jgi:hypothetical protein
VMDKKQKMGIFCQPLLYFKVRAIDPPIASASYTSLTSAECDITSEGE